MSTTTGILQMTCCYIPLQPTVLDRLAHGMLHARHNYQRILLKYVSTLRDIHTLKKVNLNSLSHGKCLTF